MRYALAFAALTASAFPVAAAPQPPTAKQLIAAYMAADEGCRGSPGDSGSSECERRTRLNSRLNQMGWCIGKQGQSRADEAWHHCTARSFFTTDLKPN